MDSPPLKPAPRPRTVIKAVLVALFCVIAVAGLALVAFEKPHLLMDPERRALEVTRARHLALAQIGQPLPGTPELDRLGTRLEQHNLKLGAAVLIRIFKREHELEIWLARDGRFHRFASYPICRWSGGLGPKFATGDRQAPEGFYSVSAAQMNPNSRWYRSFNLGFPNAFDRAHGRTGSALMVHGGCSSAGCYAMTNAVMDEIWRLVSAALAGGQKRFQVQAFPFRLSEEALAAKSNHPAAAFWADLKIGHDLFETTQLAPIAAVCRGRYQFKTGRGQSGLMGIVEKSCSGNGSVAGRGNEAKKPL